MVSRKLDQNSLKHHNISRVLLEIKHNRELIKSQLVSRLNISFATVSAICEILKKLGFITMDDLAGSTGGRKPKRIVFNPEARYIITADFSLRETLHISLVNLNYELVGSEWFDHFEQMEFDDISRYIRVSVRRLCRKHQIDENLIIGAGAAVPGVYNTGADKLHYCTNKTLNVDRIRERLQIGLQHPVFLMNDANLAALGQSIFTLPPVQNLILLYFSQGIGLGIIQNGQIFGGADGFAGELGMIKYPVKDGYKILERCINLESITKLYQLAKEKGIDATHIDDIEKFEFSGTAAAARKLAAACEKNEAEALKVIEDVAGIIGWMMANIIDLLNPDSVYIYGNIHVLLPYLLPRIRSEVAERSFLIKLRDLPIREASGENLTVMGSGKLVFHNWLSHTTF